LPIADGHPPSHFSLQEIAMRCHVHWITTIVSLVLGVGGAALVQAQPADPSPEQQQAEQAIRTAAETYIKALEAGDISTLLDLWTPDGDVVDEFGNSTPAADMVRQAAAARVNAASQGQPLPKVEITNNRIRFITPDVAIEDGTAGTADSSSPALGRFTAIWVKQQDRWRLASLREVRIAPPVAQNLDDLAWMVGKWEGAAGDVKFHIDTHWNDRHTYLIRDLTVTVGDKTLVNGQQRIGIDPLDGQIKSWMHDTDGGHGEGTWTRHGNTWIVQATGVTADGRRTTGTNLYRQDGENGLIWKSIGATSGGQPVPDFEIKLVRSAAAPGSDARNSETNPPAAK
jgi:uncharacterized protein (TIGR02246 family)